MVAAVTFPSPGFLGLNKSKDQSVLGPEWATVAQNCIIDAQGRIAARKGWSSQTTSTISGSPTLDTVHEYITAAGVTTLIASGGNKLYESSDNGATWTDRTGALSVTSDHWQFVNYNGKVLGACASHSLIVKTSGNFAAVTAASGSVPTQPVAVLAAFGRIWAISSDYQTIKYSALLDETKWSTADGGGSIDMSKVWTQGMDQGVALAAFGGRLWVFGKRHIVAWSDGKGSALGLDPTYIYVEDVIENAGCVARDSLARIGEGDLVFLSQNGVRSLTRVLQEKQTPLNDLTRNSLDYLNGVLLTGDLTRMRAVYSPNDAFYLLNHPSGSNTICFDMRQPLPDGTYRVFEWPSPIFAGLCARINGDLFAGGSGIVFKHTGYYDNGAPYTLSFRSGWLDLGEDNAQLKFLKRIKINCYAGVGVAPTIRWGWDFTGGQRSYQMSATTASSSAGGWGSARWGSGLWGGGTQTFRTVPIPTSGSGQYFRLQVDATISGATFALQGITAYYAKGRLA